MGLKGLRSIPICPRGRGSRGRGASPAGDPRPLPRLPVTGESPIRSLDLVPLEGPNHFVHIEG
eukprot:scaffold401_cov144-Skeletonema_dohrnii-CCMP3373.AAC.1